MKLALATWAKARTKATPSKVQIHFLNQIAIGNDKTGFLQQSRTFKAMVRNGWINNHDEHSSLTDLGEQILASHKIINPKKFKNPLRHWGGKGYEEGSACGEESELPLATDWQYVTCPTCSMIITVDSHKQEDERKRKFLPPISTAGLLQGLRKYKSSDRIPKEPTEEELDIAQQKIDNAFKKSDAFKTTTTDDKKTNRPMKKRRKNSNVRIVNPKRDAMGRFIKKSRKRIKHMKNSAVRLNPRRTYRQKPGRREHTLKWWLCDMYVKSKGRHKRVMSIPGSGTELEAQSNCKLLLARGYQGIRLSKVVLDGPYKRPPAPHKTS